MTLGSKGRASHARVQCKISLDTVPLLKKKKKKSLKTPDIVHCPHFVDEETGDQRGKVSLCKPHRLPCLLKAKESKDFAGG